MEPEHLLLWSKGVITGPVQLTFPCWCLHSGWQATHSPPGPANSRGTLGAQRSQHPLLDRRNIPHTNKARISSHTLLTLWKNYSCPHMCRLCCSPCRRDTGQAPGPSSLRLNIERHTRGPLQLQHTTTEGTTSGACCSNDSTISQKLNRQKVNKDLTTDLVQLIKNITNSTFHLEYGEDFIPARSRARLTALCQRPVVVEVVDSNSAASEQLRPVYSVVVTEVGVLTDVHAAIADLPEGTQPQWGKSGDVHHH